MNYKEALDFAVDFLSGFEDDEAQEVPVNPALEKLKDLATLFSLIKDDETFHYLLTQRKS